MTDPLQELGDQIAAALPGDVIRTEIAHGELIVWAERAAIARVLDVPARRSAPAASSVLVDICGVDYPDRPSASRSSTIC